MVTSVTPYVPRLADRLIGDLLAELPALAVVGPRASGKTTTAARHARTTIQLDRPAQALAVAADPDAALRGLDEPVLLDEWQEVPEVLGAVKRACDAEPRPGRYILTGSVRAETQTRTWPGTGRVTRLEMYPLTAGEQHRSTTAPLLDRIADMMMGGADSGQRDRPVPQFSDQQDLTTRPEPLGLDPWTGLRLDAPSLPDYVNMAIRGGFPQATLTVGEQARRHWLSSYIDEVVTRDASAAGAGASTDASKLRRYFETYCLNSAGVTDDAAIYSVAGIDRRTALAYHELLDRLYVIGDLPAWSSNRLKRLSRMPKRLMIDSSLLASVTGANERSVMRDGNLLGRLLETFVVAQLRAQATVSEHRCSLYHLRQHHGRHEIDVIAELDAHTVIALEIKATASPTADDARHLAWFRDEAGGRFMAGIILHTGAATVQIGTGIWALPICSLWS